MNLSQSSSVPLFFGGKNQLTQKYVPLRESKVYDYGISAKGQEIVLVYTLNLLKKTGKNAI